MIEIAALLLGWLAVAVGALMLILGAVLIGTAGLIAVQVVARRIRHHRAITADDRVIEGVARELTDLSCPAHEKGGPDPAPVRTRPDSPRKESR